MKWSSDFKPEVLQAPKGLQWINLVWLASDQERNPNWSWLETFKRNWFANFKSVVIGVAAYPRQWVSTMDGQNWPVRGFGFAYVHADGHLLPRPWICRRGLAVKFKLLRVCGFPVLVYPVLAQMEIGAGWKSHGGFGINYRSAGTPNAGPRP